MLPMPFQGPFLFSGALAAGSRLLNPPSGSADPFRENVRPAAKAPENMAPAGPTRRQRERDGERRSKSGFSGVSLKSPTATIRAHPAAARESLTARRRATATSRRQSVSPPPYLEGWWLTKTARLSPAAVMNCASRMSRVCKLGALTRQGCALTSVSRDARYSSAQSIPLGSGESKCTIS